MNKTGLKLAAAVFAVTFSAWVLTGCGNNNSNNSNDKNGTNGSITLAGSTALQPLAEYSAEKFIEKYPSAIINVQGGGSGTGINMVSSGAIDIGNSDVPAEIKIDKAKAAELVDHKVCAIGFALVVNKEVNISTLTKQQVQDIFTGKITNWKDAGGPDLKIEVIHRAKSSGTRAAFRNAVLDGKDENDSIGTIQDSNGNVEKALASTKGSVSYLALSYLSDKVKESVKPLKLDGIDANKDNIISGKYYFWSYEHMYTKGEAEGLEKLFIEYMISDENKSLIEKLGYIPVSEIKVK